MLENLYTTKMSASKKTLQNRFMKIRSKSGRLSKAMAMVTSFVIASAMICASVVMAAVGNEDDFIIEITDNGQTMDFKNTPFIAEDTVYIPLRELLQKIRSDYIVEWNSGEITIRYFFNVQTYYKIKIGESMLTAPLSQFTGGEHSIEMNEAPILKDGVTYIPYEYSNYLISQPQNLGYKVYYSDRTLISEITNDVYSGAQSDIYNTVEKFFEYSESGDTANMKNLCSSEYAEKSLLDSEICGFVRWTVYAIENGTKIYNNNKYRAYIGGYYASESEKFPKVQKKVCLTFEKQEDKGYVISDIEFTDRESEHEIIRN